MLAQAQAQAHTRVCSTCEKPQPISEFDRRDNAVDGYRRQCRSCLRTQRAERYQANAAARIAASRAYYAANKKVVIEKELARYAKNRQARLTQRRERYRRDAVDLCAAKRQRRALNPELAKANERARYLRDGPARRRKHNRARRARVKGLFVETVDLDVVFRRDGGVCGLCHLSVRRADASVDHIVPLARGGEHSYKNAQLAHLKCNKKKQTKVQGQLRLLG